MSFDKESGYMSKIHVILVEFFVFFFFFFFFFFNLNVNSESNLFSNKNMSISVFGYFIIHKLYFQKRVKIKEK